MQMQKNQSCAVTQRGCCSGFSNRQLQNKRPVHGTPIRHILHLSTDDLFHGTRESNAVILRASSSAGGDKSGNDRAVFDGEEEWEVAEGRKLNTRVQNVTIVGQVFGSLSLLVDGLTDLSLQFVPEHTPYDVVRAGVTGALILCVFSLVKGVLSLFLTVGTLLLGAFIATRIYGTGSNHSGTISMESSRRSRSKAKEGSKSKRVSRKPASIRSDSVADHLMGFITSSLPTGGEDNDLLEVKFKSSKRAREAKKKK